LPGQRHLAADVDDRTRGALQQGTAVVQQRVGRQQVGAQRREERFATGFEPDAVVAAGVVDQHVEATERQRRRDRALAGRVLGEIAEHELHRRQGLLQFRGELCLAFGDDDTRTFADERFDDGAADAAATARHQHHLAGELQVHAHSAATTGLRSTPRPSTSTSQTSPGFR
jgi:hypothetical protein